jgi:cell division septal protein FtsQ
VKERKKERKKEREKERKKRLVKTFLSVKFPFCFCHLLVLKLQLG